MSCWIGIFFTILVKIKDREKIYGALGDALRFFLSYFYLLLFVS
jgi:hypothetical protein